MKNVTLLHWLLVKGYYSILNNSFVIGQSTSTKYPDGHGNEIFVIQLDSHVAIENRTKIISQLNNRYTEWTRKNEPSDERITWTENQTSNVVFSFHSLSHSLSIHILKEIDHLDPL